MAKSLNQEMLENIDESKTHIQRKYNNEREGQMDFYTTFLPRVDSGIDIHEDILEDYSDGILNGNILEFKLHIDDLNSVLFQTIKYLSSMRLNGKPIPANIVLVSLDDTRIYMFNSNDYLSNIEQVYSGGASKNNTGFVSGDAIETLNYDIDIDSERLIEILKTNNHIRIHLDENCIVGWATSYYRAKPNANKASFLGDEKSKVKIIGEIRKPEIFKDFIYPYTKPTNEKFRYLMDKLNDFMQKKDLGAFYTDPLYANKSLELVRMAIKRVPQGNDYVIIDRCAGTGNLELSMSKEELSHVIVSTIEYYEYKVLLETLGDKVRHIIPPTEKEDTFYNGQVRGADALSEDYINNQIIKQYIDNPKYTIILFENPPYAETTSIEHQKRKAGKKSSSWKNSFAVQRMRDEVKGTVLNDLGNVFIWTAFKYYLRQPTDSYIVYSPVKYWKAQHLVNKKLLNGFAFNRRHFHNNVDACIMCALWSNEVYDCKTIYLHGFDIKEKKLKGIVKELKVDKVFKKFSSEYYMHDKFNDQQENGILIGLNGLEAGASVKRRIRPIYSKNMVGYLVADSVGFDNPDAKSSLLVSGRYNGNGFYLHKDNYIEKLPMFAASRYITYNRQWTERGRIMKSADGADRYFHDLKAGKLDSWLLKCLLFTVFEPQNHMRSFLGSDGRNYRNELCLDITNGPTLASEALKKMVKDEDEQKMIILWNKIMKEAKNTSEYNSTLTYGLYQIKTDLNTTYKDEFDATKYHYPDLNGDIKSLAERVKMYYNSEIVPVLFEYEFLK